MIKGLTDKDSIKPQFPLSGRLRKGAEKQNGKVGQDLNHFRFTSDDPAVAALFEKVYGTEPQQLRVYLPYEKPEDNFEASCEIWSTTGLVHRCDGETMSIWRDGDKYVRGSKPCTGGHKDDDPLNDATARLFLLLPDLILAGHVGYVMMTTKSKHDIKSIMSSLFEVYNNGGDLRKAEFLLRRVLTEISTPGYGKQKGKRSRTRKWLVQLIPAADWVRRQIEATADTKLFMLADPEDAIIDGAFIDKPKPQPEPEPEPEPLPKAKPPAKKTKKTAAKAPLSELTVGTAAQMITAKGSKLCTLDDDQLQLLVDKSAQKDLKAAAALLLETPNEDVWAKWYEKVDDAAKAGVSVTDLPDNANNRDVANGFIEVAVAIEAQGEPA